MKIKLKIDNEELKGKEFSVIDIDSAREKIKEGKTCVFKHPKMGIQLGKQGKVFDLNFGEDFEITQGDPKPAPEKGLEGLKPAAADQSGPKNSDKDSKDSKKK